MHRTRVRVVEDVLDANATIARANRADFDRAGVRVVNLMSAPGAGKTTLLERSLARLGVGNGGPRIGVLEGDVQGTLDADRLASLHVPVVQLNTDPGFGGECHLDANMVRSALPALPLDRLDSLHVPVVQVNTDPGFGGECHLDANMVRSALPSLPLDRLDLLVIENVGNLVCPAEFRVGEDHRVMVASVTEGEDKPLKYPLMFRACELVLVNKIDLLPHLDFDLNRFLYNLDAVHPGVTRLLVSARTGEGLAAWCDWLRAAAG
jgi:hydrogenase nickel incorporation protein HypB